jgi:hypothetical protein
LIARRMLTPQAPRCLAPELRNATRVSITLRPSRFRRDYGLRLGEAMITMSDTEIAVLSYLITFLGGYALRSYISHRRRRRW